MLNHIYCASCSKFCFAKDFKKVQSQESKLMQKERRQIKQSGGRVVSIIFSFAPHNFSHGQDSPTIASVTLKAQWGLVG